MNKYRIIALMGEAGSGKDTILQLLLACGPGIMHEIISCTTRPPREGEKEGVNYFFLSPEEFFDKYTNDEFIEIDSFNNWNYGTLKTALSKDLINVGIFTPRGIRKLMQNKDIELVIFYLRAPGKERLLRQLKRETDPDIDEIIRRYKTDETDFRYLGDIPYIAINNGDSTPSGMTKVVEDIISKLFK